MQLQFPFVALLSGLLVALSSTYLVADALPLSEGRSIGRVTLPLHRIPQRRDIHPQILLQQHINRAHRRLARMTGREEPSDEELARNLQKRVLAVEGPEGLQKRYDRKGTRPVKPSAKKQKSTKNATSAQNLKDSSSSGADIGHNLATADTVTKANPPTADNSLGLDIEANDIGYLATVQVGTPPQDFLLLMDSGSADLWIGAENCQSEDGGNCGNHKFLGPNISQTFVNTSKPFSITYGTGSVSGNVITDNLEIAGLQLNKHTFGVATTESVEFSDNSTSFDGLMGLAKSVLSNQKVPTPIEALAEQGLVKSAVIGYKISRLADNKNDGEITFGGVDPTKFDPQAAVTLDNVSNRGFWEAAMDSASVNGQDLRLDGRTAILDTGTTLMVIPADDANKIHSQIQGARTDGQGSFTVPCNTSAVLALTFGGQTFEIDPRDLAFQPLDPNDPNGNCISGITSGNIGGATEWLIGDTFLKNAYFATDVGSDQLMLAKLV